MRKLLIVEDDPEVAQLLCQMARVAGVEHERAASGAEAMACYWRAVAEGRPFVGILLDLALPGVDGLSVAERIRGIEAEGLAPVVFIHGYTGYGEHMMSQESLRRARLDRFTEKPGLPSELREWMTTL